MLKRILLFFVMNVAVMIIIGIILAIVNVVFGVNIYANDIVSVLVFALIVGFTGAFISLGISRWSAKRLYKIILLTDANVFQASAKEQQVYNLISRLAQENGIRMPEVGIYVDRDPNAFATGATRNASLVAVSTALLEQCTPNEIEGVIAHEMSHIFNGDMVTMTLLQWVLNTFVIFLSRIAARVVDEFTDGKLGALGYQLVYILLQIVLGLGASLIAMRFSRYREYRADYGSAKLVGKAKMIAALRRLQTLQPATIAMNDDKLTAFKISSWEKKTSLFMSHPSLEDRIKALENDYQLA